MKQSSVEWLANHLDKYIPEGNQIAVYALLEQAKAMNEQEMIDFANWCRIHDSSHPNEVWTIDQLWDKYQNNTPFKSE